MALLCRQCFLVGPGYPQVWNSHSWYDSEMNLKFNNKSQRHAHRHTWWNTVFTTFTSSLGKKHDVLTIYRYVHHHLFGFLKSRTRKSHMANNPCRKSELHNVMLIQHPFRIRHWSIAHIFHSSILSRCCKTPLPAVPILKLKKKVFISLSVIFCHTDFLQGETNGSAEITGLLLFISKTNFSHCNRILLQCSANNK